jgi:GxxExxY protein
MNGDLRMPPDDLDKLTEKIIGCAYRVSNTLGIGFVEKVYENAHAHEMRKDGLQVVQQYPIKVMYDGVVVGEFFSDMLVNNRVLVELKAVSDLDESHYAQALNYLRATGLELYLRINFGKTRVQIRSLKPSPNWKRV